MSNYTSNRFFGSYSLSLPSKGPPLASVASPTETVVLIQPLLCFAPLLHPPRLSCVGTTSSALQQENSIVGRQKLFNHWNSCRLLQRYTQSSQHSLLFIVGPVECSPDYVFAEYDRPRARRHGAQDRRTRCPSRASSRLHAQLTKLFERCLFYYTGHSHRDIFPGKLTAPSPETSHTPTLAVDLPVECPPDYVFVEYDRPRARRHGALFCD